MASKDKSGELPIISTSGNLQPAFVNSTHNTNLRVVITDDKPKIIASFKRTPLVELLRDLGLEV